MNVRRHEILPCPGTCTSEFALKTRGLLACHADGDGTFSEGENTQKRPSPQPRIEISHEIRNSVLLLAGAGPRENFRPGTRPCCKCRLGERLVSIFTSEGRRSPRSAAIRRLTAFSVCVS